MKYPASRLAGILGHKEIRHGMYGTPIYRTWIRFNQRCNNPNNRNYKDYGARGIKVSDSWRSFENFYNDMGQKPENLTLERIDNNKGYSKENCTWASRAEQARNRRTTKFYHLNGESKSVSEWARKLGISHTTLTKRIRKWNLERALTEGKHHEYTASNS